MKTMQISNPEYEQLPYQLILLRENDTAKLYFIPEKKTMICQAVNSYMPEEDFRDFFKEIGNYVATYRPENFVFDKRALKAFHQPSMEWYFPEWKTQMANLYGLRKHRKILPDIKWFRLAVQAGRAELDRKYPESLFRQLDIQYSSSLLEAVNS